GDKAIPDVPVKKIVNPAATGSSQEIIQKAIDELAAIQPDKNGFRGVYMYYIALYFCNNPFEFEIVIFFLPLLGIVPCLDLVHLQVSNPLTCSRSEKNDFISSFQPFCRLQGKGFRPNGHIFVGDLCSCSYNFFY